MPIVIDIKQKILQLEAGAFQNLCNSYLYKNGYSNMVALGGEAGTQKTTPGTPDTYFYTVDGKYVFAEYTTQQSRTYMKIKSDISKCLEHFNDDFPNENLAEIIVCHTVSNITPEQDSELRNLCASKKIKITIIGIDKLAEELYSYHRDIVRDHLGIPFGTEQVKTYDEFIEDYSSRKSAAPLNTKFLLRTKEIEEIEKAFEDVDVVILRGDAGVGKTRLALHYAKNHADVNNEVLYCIHNNYLPIYEDLKLALNEPGNYFLFVDDANYLSVLQHVIEYTIKKPDGYKVKILITVRNTGLCKVEHDISEIVKYTIIHIKRFKDDEIKELMENVLGIKNPYYQDRIINIAEGNARIAFIAGEIACDSNRLDSINDVSQLYEDYYKPLLKKDPIFSNRETLVIIGFISYYERIFIKKIELILPLLNHYRVNEDSFLKIIYKLNSIEIVDIIEEKVVRISDQCFSNFILKYVLFDTKTLILSDMIRFSFPNNKERTISVVNILLDIFRNNEIIDYLSSQIVSLWDELESEKSDYFFDYLKTFSQFNPTKTLLFIKQRIRDIPSIYFDLSSCEKKKREQSDFIYDETIIILGGFTNTRMLPEALDLFFEYFLKRGDLYWEFTNAVIQFFGIDSESSTNDFYTQIVFVEKIREHSKNWSIDSLTLLFLEIAQNFLNLQFTSYGCVRKHKFTMYRFKLLPSEGVYHYRKKIWEALIEIGSNVTYRLQLQRVIKSYDTEVDSPDVSLLKFDIQFITDFMKTFFPPGELGNSLIVRKLKQCFKKAGLEIDPIFTEYFNLKKYLLFEMLAEPDKDFNKSSIDDTFKYSAVEKYISEGGLTAFKQLIDVCFELVDYSDDIPWKLRDGIVHAFEAAYEKKEFYVEAVIYYIEKNTPLSLYPNKFVGYLFDILPDEEIYSIIIGREYDEKNSWEFAYFSQIPKHMISEQHLQKLYAFLSDKSDQKITTSSYRDLEFLEKYAPIDKNVLQNVAKIILPKIEYSPFIVNIYFSLLFNPHCNSPSYLVSKFIGELPLLANIYFMMLSSKHGLDYDGSFLRELYLAYPPALQTYIDLLVDDKIDKFNHNDEIHRCFYDLKNYIEIYNEIFNVLSLKSGYPRLDCYHYLEKILSISETDRVLLEKQDKWIKQSIIHFSNDEVKMYSLFAAISTLANSRKKEYVILFLHNNPSFENFKRIPLTPPSYSYSESCIPLYSSWIDYLESLLPSFLGIDWLDHKDYIESKIKYYKKLIEDEQLEKILNG